MAAAAPRSGAGGRAGCSWPQPGVGTPAPVPPARRFDAAWRRAGSGSRRRRQQENTGVQWDSVQEERQLASGIEAVSKAVEEAGPPVKRGCRKRRHSCEEDPQELGGGACKRGCFAEEDSGTRSV
ncbi:uncharacterized protein AAGF69_016675 isoform 2-T7 [Amazona ochrocephala]